jgi:hypothetical protein
MKRSVFQTAPARALILILAVGALAGYVAMVSCSRTVVPPAASAPPAAPVQQAAPPAPAVPGSEKEKNQAPSQAVDEPEPRLYGPASKSDLILPPVKKPANDRRFYGSATKSVFVIKPPREEPPVVNPPQGSR